MVFPTSGVPALEETPAPAEVASRAANGPDPPLQAWHQAPTPQSSQAGRRARRIGWELIQTLLLAALIFFAVRSMAQNFRVEGSSMEPGLHDGQYLLVNRKSVV